MLERLIELMGKQPHLSNLFAVTLAFLAHACYNAIVGSGGQAAISD